MSVDDYENWRIDAELISKKVYTTAQAEALFKNDPKFLKWYLENYVETMSYKTIE
jgi:hypothetical protein